jgi:outer membrane protein, heavy metal efflux system
MKIDLQVLLVLPLLLSMAAVTLSARPVDAADAFPLEDATLDDMLRFAAENNPSMRAAFEEWRAATERVTPARSLPDPELSYSYYVQRMDTRQAVSLSQMFPGFGKRSLRAGVAEQRALAAQQRFEAEQRVVFAAVKRAYAEYAYATEVVEIVRRNQGLVRQFEDVALARLRTGEVSDADVLRVQMESDRLADEIITLEEMREPAAALLNSVLGRPAEAPLPTVRLERGEPLFDESGPAADWVQGNPALRASDFEVRAAEEGVRLAGRESVPDFMVGIEYMDNRTGRDEVAVMAGVTLPIWQNRYAAERREARAMQRVAEAMRENMARELEAEARMARFRVRDAERKMALYGERLLPRAEQTVNSLGRGYRAGNVDFIEWIDAQRMLLDVEMNYLRAVADHRQSVADFQRLTGGSFSRAATEEEIGPR